MAYQTDSLKREVAEAPLECAARTSTEFADDVLTLAELQARLLVLESKEWAQTRFRSALLAAIAAVVVMGLIPVGFLTMAAMFVEFAAFSHLQALSLSLVLGLICCAGLIVGARVSFNAILAPFERSRREWNSNVRWFRNMVRRSGRRW